MIDDSWKHDLHAFIGGTLRRQEASPLDVGGVSDHVHALVSLRATHTIADLVREAKKASSAWARERFLGFRWQEGYGAFTVSTSDLDRVRSYITNQTEHHHQMTSDDELRMILAEHGIVPDERFFE